MSGFLPIVDELADCQNNQERARWLLACPLGLLRSHGGEIRVTLRNCQFHEGVDYVDAELVALGAVRSLTGEHSIKTEELLKQTRDRIWPVAYGAIARG